MDSQIRTGDGPLRGSPRYNRALAPSFLNVTGNWKNPLVQETDFSAKYARKLMWACPYK
jgi:hypothetical protein